MNRPKVAIVHDYFVQCGGAERVASALSSLFPEAPVFSTVALPDRLPPDMKNTKITTTWMQNLPAMRRYYRHYFLLYPMAVEALNLDEFDLIISSSSGYAKGVKRNSRAIHICYCHTPMRWVWNSASYLKSHEHNPLARRMLSLALGLLEKWDRRAAQRPDYYIANSKAVAKRIETIYQRPAKVIPPPIDVDRFEPSLEDGGYYLILSRLVRYKRIDLAVSACTQLGKKLVVIGEGPELSRLRAIAGPTVEFLRRQPDSVVNHHASRCKALIFPGEEDFGMAPLEVNAAGRPVIAFRAGGALETVVEGETGLFFDEPTTMALCQAICRFEEQRWDSTAIRAHAMRFNGTVFASRIRDFVASVS